MHQEKRINGATVNLFWWLVLSAVKPDTVENTTPKNSNFISARQAVFPKLGGKAYTESL
jgi:hypothetical protein